jgi:hypothetical protein
MHRLTVPAVICAAAMLVGLAACAAKGPAEQAGGPETPSPVPITVNPSALPVGDSIPTGVLIGGKELVLYFWGTAELPYLDQAWRDRGSGVVDVDNVCAGGTGVGADVGPDAGGRWFNVVQCVTPDGTLIEFGGVRGEVARVTSTAGGATVQARYARWSANRAITVFWLQRQGKPLPRNVDLGSGRTSPGPAELYPLITAYDGNGGTIAELRLRPSAAEPKGG